jgi:AcrR family transcriptional regulator
LLSAAVAAIQRHGPGASMEQLAAEAGVTKPNLYWYFGDKGGLYEAIAHRYVDLVAAEVRTAIGTSSEPRETLVAGIEAYLRLVESEPNIYRFLMQRARFEQSTTQRAIDHFLRQLGQELGLLVGDRLAAAGQDTGGAEVFGHAIVGMVNTTADWWVERSVLPRTRLVGYLTELLWDGLARTPLVEEIGQKEG